MSSSYGSELNHYLASIIVDDKRILTDVHIAALKHRGWKYDDSRLRLRHTYHLKKGKEITVAFLVANARYTYHPDFSWERLSSKVQYFTQVTLRPQIHASIESKEELTREEIDAVLGFILNDSAIKPITITFPEEVIYVPLRFAGGKLYFLHEALEVLVKTHLELEQLIAEVVEHQQDQSGGAN